MTTRTYWEGMQLHMLHVAHKAGSFPSCHCSSKSSVRIMPKSKQELHNESNSSVLGSIPHENGASAG